MLSWPPSKHIDTPWDSVTSAAPSGARTTSAILRSSSMLCRNCGISFKMMTPQQIQLPLLILNLRFSWLFLNVLLLAVLLLAPFSFQAQFRAFQCISCSIPAVPLPSSASRWQLSLARCLSSSFVQRSYCWWWYSHKCSYPACCLVVYRPTLFHL